MFCMPKHMPCRCRTGNFSKNCSARFCRRRPTCCPRNAWPTKSLKSKRKNFWNPLMTCFSAFSKSNLPRRGGFYLLVWLACFGGLIASPHSVQAAGEKKVHIKIATLAPEGSTWMKILHDLDKELKSKTNGN